MPAANGQLVFLCGGDKELFDIASADLDLMGKVIITIINYSWVDCHQTVLIHTKCFPLSTRVFSLCAAANQNARCVPIKSSPWGRFNPWNLPLLWFRGETVAPPGVTNAIFLFSCVTHGTEEKKGGETLRGNGNEALVLVSLHFCSQYCSKM